MKDSVRINKALQDLARQYPPDEVAQQLIMLPRAAFHVELAAQSGGPGGSVCDIGGGLGMFSVGCAVIGMDSTLIDDFQDEGNKLQADEVLALHRSRGVKVMCRDVAAEGLGFVAGQFDVVTAFDTIEHWHCSPKPALHQMMKMLKPGGTMIISLPNGVDLLKRIQVPLGMANWSSMKDWYEEPVFRGHVREARIADLHYIARDIGLNNVRVFGRTWARSRRGWQRSQMLVRALDRGLSLFPGLCSSIYLVGTAK